MIVRADDFASYFTCQGRRYAEGGRLFLNASGASLKGLFRGSALILILFSEPIEKGREAYVRLTLDGRTRRIRLPKGEKVIRIKTEQGEHLFELIKLTESANNSFAIVRAETDGVFLPLKESKHLRIEFVGDSISTGFGVLCREKYGEYKTKEQDATKAFPYLVSRALDASYHVVAAGGWPIWKSKYSPYAIPDYYDHIDLLRNADKWDFSLFRPDLVVVTLGTNDFSYLADLSEDKRASEREEIKRHFILFLKKLLGQGVPVLAVYGFFEYPDLGVMTEEAVREIADPRLSTLEVESAASLDDVCAGHPGRKTHRLAAKSIVRRIREILGSRRD